MVNTDKGPIGKEDGSSLEWHNKDREENYAKYWKIK